ncbi:hypothetical protein FB451DRAFT_1552968 [Mycena latifolia]|nr:hypothetical protein FB451DRAFT_1552968 [Mycena latifolia]
MSSNMPDGSSAFPVELEREIFETAATLHPETIPALLRVAHRVLVWIEPLLYRTLAITHRRQLEAVLQKPPSFLRENVRNLMFWMDERDEDMSTLLSICAGIQALALFDPPPQLFGFLGPLHLRRLAIPIVALFSARAPISPTSAFMADLTHLRIHSQRNMAFPSYFSVGALPSLTHLCFECPGAYCTLIQVHKILETCQKLQALVCMFNSHEELEQSEVVPERPWIDDPRVVIMVLTRSAFVPDWRLGVAGGRDFWARADEFLATKRSDKTINGSSTFPLELEREIFETTAGLHPETISALLRVAHRVLVWIEPLLYRTLVITHRRQLEAVLQRSPSFLSANVRAVMLRMDELDDEMCTLISICPGIQALALSNPPLRLFRFLQPLHLRRLAIPMFALYSSRALISPTSAFMAAVSHLHIHSQRNMAFPSHFSVGALPSLTHLCFECPGVFSDVAQLHKVLEDCKKLQVLVCLFDNHQELAQCDVDPDEPWIDDPRIMVMVLQQGLTGGRDFWTRAEELIAEKRSDKTHIQNPATGDVQVCTELAKTDPPSPRADVLEVHHERLCIGDWLKRLGISMATSSNGGLSNSTTADGVSLLELPRELILLIFDWIPEKDLIRLYEVSSVSKKLALLAILAHYGVSESQLQSQELSNIPSRALHALSACYPTMIANIRVLDVHFNPRDADSLAEWHALEHLAERFPVIPKVTVAFSEPPTRTQILSHLWGPLSTALVSLTGNTSQPAVVFRYAEVVTVRPRPPKLLKRALRTSPGSSSIPMIDKQKLTKKIQYSIATLSTHKPFSSIQVRSFTQPEAALGSLVILNPDAIFHLTISADVISAREWQFAMSDLYLPSLRTLFIRVDLEYQSLSAFLDRHNSIEHLEFSSDWGCLHDHGLPPFSILALPRLKHISAGSRVLARILQTPNDFPLLDYVCISPRDSTTNDADSRNNFQAVLRAIAARSSVTNLMIQIHGVHPPWKTFDAMEPTAEETLQYVEELHILPWTPGAECDAFPHWLAKFPALTKLTIAGNLFQPTRGPLLSNWLAEGIKTVCPHVFVKQERRLG